MFIFTRITNIFVYVKITRDIGISNEGYIEILPVSLPTSSSLSMTFSTRKSNAVLLFATKTKFKKFRQKRLTDTVSVHYAIWNVFIYEI